MTCFCHDCGRQFQAREWTALCRDCARAREQQVEQEHAHEQGYGDGFREGYRAAASQSVRLDRPVLRELLQLCDPSLHEPERMAMAMRMTAVLMELVSIDAEQRESAREQVR
jgi:hypothetical protein